MAKSTLLKYKIHWHVIFTHFPASFFAISFVFMILYHLTGSACHESASFLCLLAGAVILVPTVVSGWVTWKNRYKGMRGKIFIYKIRIAIGMMIGSVLIVVVRLLLPNEPHIVWMLIYTPGVFLLSLGAMAEGYYGGRLNHR